ncbi:hypothetical protein P389DRAFT_210705 [Cystobasidium minutum MCA 4210]|uniref:uncharacterized protein n=1 Tax=Cystobasidium minutum MCA 4210 TaxID=1397322 RepID=UPI0034CF9EA0|eukprot:jgi/Rhomi1/210705/estExt_Genemark1.C_4_t10272
MPGINPPPSPMRDPAWPPDSPTWKLPPFPAPALPPLTRQNKVIITCSQFMEDPEEATKLKRQILNGSGEALSVVFDVGEYLEEFIPEVKKIFSLAFSISSIELHTANLDMEAEFLQNFLDTLPSHGELRAFSLVTAKDTPLMFVTISGLMNRNPKLVGIRLWGVDLTIAGTGNQYYPQCNLLRADFAHCHFHPEQLNVLLGSSQESLLCLKFEKLQGVSGSFIARAVKNYGRHVQMLSILLPNESDSDLDMEATYLVGDTASQFPYCLKYLHLGGLAASDNLFNVTPTATKKGQIPTTHLDTIVALRLDDCPRLSVNGLFGAMRHGQFKSLLRLHAYWLERDDVLSDVQVWKGFAASQDIRVDTSQEGLVWLSATKEFASMAPGGPGAPALPAPVAVVDPRSMPRVHEVARPGMPHTFPPDTHLQRGIPGRHGTAGSKTSRHKRRDSDSSSGSSSSSLSSDSESDSGSDSDDSAYHSSRNRGHKPQYGGRHR